MKLEDKLNNANTDRRGYKPVSESRQYEIAIFIRGKDARNFSRWFEDIHQHLEVHNTDKGRCRVDFQGDYDCDEDCVTTLYYWVGARMEDLEPALADYGDGHNGYSFDIIVEEGNDIVLSFVKGERHGGLTDEQRVLLKERLANRSSE